jgi:hypothetical protein
MNLFPLTIFPEGGLAGSIITTVWVGVFVMCFFNLRYGWVLSGLVVPGYLVPLLIVKPFAALVISVEAVLAYLLVWLFSEKLAPGRFPSLFGRDRFMGLILASIAIRLSFDGYLLPEFSTWLESNFDRRIDWENNLQSFGLVIISLMANQFWKPGLKRGLPMAIVTIGLTYLIIRYGLMELTNFRISGVYYLYEGLASSILASPKAYMILTLTALIASHYNVKYGWDFSGILIPALIALQWYQPTKILTSFGEAIVIYTIARMVLSLPIMANVTLEGGRKLLLFFNISFAWKLALGWVIVLQGIDIKMTDFFGFGYLLSTLIAIKAHDKDIFPRLARSTLQVSLAGAVLGNFLGFTLTAATTRAPWNDAPAPASDFRSSDSPQMNALVVNAVGDAYTRKMRKVALPVSEESGASLARLIELIEEGVPEFALEFDQRASGWRVRGLENGRLAIIRDDGKGAELLIFDPNASGAEAIILPDPTQKSGLAMAALALQRNQNARWLVLSAPSYSGRLEGGSVAEIFFKTTDMTHIILGASAKGASSSFAFSDRAAASSDVAGLRSIVPDLAINLAQERIGAKGAHASLQLSDAALRSISSKVAGLTTERPEACKLSRDAAEDSGWTGLHQLSFARFEIAAPMIERVRNGNAPELASAAAQLAGMQIERCHFDQKVHWALSSPNRDEGNIFMAEGAELHRAVLTFENSRGVLPTRIGAAVHNNWNSSALFVANRSDSFLRDPRSIFDATWQEWVRSQEGLDDQMIFQLRARPAEAVNYRKGVDVLVAKDRIGSDKQAFTELVSALRKAGLRAETVTNSVEQAGMEARPSMSMRYLEGTSERRYAFGWLMFAGVGGQSK